MCAVLPAPVFPPVNPITGINADGTITGPYPRVGTRHSLGCGGPLA